MQSQVVLSSNASFFPGAPVGVTRPSEFTGGRVTSLILPSTCNCVNQGLEEWELGPEYLLVFSNGGKGHGVGGGREIKELCCKMPGESIWWSQCCKYIPLRPPTNPLKLAMKDLACSGSPGGWRAGLAQGCTWGTVSSRQKCNGEPSRWVWGNRLGGGGRENLGNSYGLWANGWLGSSVSVFPFRTMSVIQNMLGCPVRHRKRA